MMWECTVESVKYLTVFSFFTASSLSANLMTFSDSGGQCLTDCVVLIMCIRLCKDCKFILKVVGKVFKEFPLRKKIICM